MAYRKGGRRIVKKARSFTAEHPVAGSIRRGSRWFDAWAAEMTTSCPALMKRTKIKEERPMQLSHGEEPTDAEVEILAAAWFVTPDGLRQSTDQAKSRG